MGVAAHDATRVSLDIAYLSVQGDDRALGTCDNSGLPRHAVFTTILPCAPRDLRTLIVELGKEPPWCSDLGELEVWDLQALSEYLTREPAEFPLLRSVETELKMHESYGNENYAEALLPGLSALRDAGLLHVFCDEMTLGIEPLPTRED